MARGGGGATHIRLGRGVLAEGGEGGGEGCEEKNVTDFIMKKRELADRARSNTHPLPSLNIIYIYTEKYICTFRVYFIFIQYLDPQCSGGQAVHT